MSRGVMAALMTALFPVMASAATPCTRDAAGTETCTYYGITFTTAQVMRFAPEVQFHFAERYFPAGVEFLAASSLLYEQTNGRGQTLGNAPTLDELATKYQWNDGTRTGYRLEIGRNNRAAYYGEDLVLAANGAGRRVAAPMYVSVQVPTDQSYLELNFIMLYAYNGPQTLRALRLGDHFNFMISSLAEHQGDFETVSVRVSPDLERVLSVRYEAHGNSRYFWPEQVTFVKDPVTGKATHPIASAALHSHATYNPTGYCPQDWEFLGELSGVMGPIDLLGKDFNLDWCGGGYAASSVKWRPWESPSSLKLVGLHEGEPVNDQKWVKFQGRFGMEQTNDVKGFGGIRGTLAGDEQAYLHTLNILAWGPRKFAELFGALKNLYQANGPLGLGTRDIVDTRAHNANPYYIRSFLRNAATGTNNLTLTENAAPKAGARYTVEAADTCRASQVWDVTIWPGSTHATAGWGALALANRSSRQLIVSQGAFLPLVSRPFSLPALRQGSLWIPEGYWLTPASQAGQHMNVFGNDYANHAGTGVGSWDGGLCPITGVAGVFCPNSSWSLDVAPCARPESTVELSGRLGLTGKYATDVTVTLKATSNASGATAAARYRLNGGAWQTYYGPFTVTAEGTTALSYYAVDSKGSAEETTHNVSIVIDRISATFDALLPAPNAYGWYNANVTITFTCHPSIPAGCPAPWTFTHEGADQYTRQALISANGSYLVRTIGPVFIDKTAPVVTFTGNAGTYTVDQDVKITCSATDALSGVHGGTCPNVNAPAYELPVGSHTLVANMQDRAGNTTFAMSPFEVKVTFESAAALIRRFVHNPRLAELLIDGLSRIALATNNPDATNAFVDFRGDLQAQIDAGVSRDHASVLENLAEKLASTR